MCVRQRGLFTAVYFLFAIPAVVLSAPTLTVTSQALNGFGNRVWLAQVTPDGGELPSALAAELGFTIMNATLVDVAGDTNVAAGISDNDTWYYQTSDGLPYGGLGTNGLWVADPNNPDLQNLGNNLFTGTVTEGLYTDTAAQQLFASLGSEVFTTDSAFNLLQIVTTSESDAMITWTDGLIAQNGVVTTGISGSASVTGGLQGDFNGSGVLDSADIDLLGAEILAQSNAGSFDLDGDNVVDQEDTRVWIEDLKMTLLGDTNLDFVVNAQDLNTLGLNWQQAGPFFWSGGDFDSSGDVGASDLNKIGLNWQRSAALATAVPEPASFMMFAFWGMLLIHAVRVSRRNLGRTQNTTCIFRLPKGATSCLLLTLFATVVPAARVSAITIMTGNSSLFPTSAEVIAATPAQTAFHDTATDSLSQTFQVGSDFEMQSIFVVYGNETAGDLDVGLQIFFVEDVAAPMLPVIDLEEFILLDTSIMAPTAGEDTVMQIILDDPLSLPMTPDSFGYAVRFENPDFRWGRTTSEFGDVYPFGQAYENSAEKSSPRDFSLALSAVGDSVVIHSVMSGLITDASTWESGTLPSPGNQYVVVNGHSVTADGSAPFAGDLLKTQDGSLAYSANKVTVPAVEVNAGNSVTETLNGDFFLGDVLAPTLSRMTLNGDLTVDLENGGDFGLDVALFGTGNVTVNGTGGTQFFITSIAGFEGNIQFNGSGDEVLYEGPTGSAMTLEMNSTGTNRLALNAASFGGLSNEIVFNQEGEIEHGSDGSTGANNRLMSIGSLTVNANITIDLTTTYARDGTPNERRLFAANGWRGAGNITATGTSTDPTSGNTTLNELEIGGTSQDDPDVTHIATDSYSGTLTANDFLNVEVRHHIPSAEVIVNQDARLEFGHRDVESLFTTSVGEVSINNGGSLEVGYEEDDVHAPYGLRLTKQWGRSGDLTINDGATTILQISGTQPNKFDQIVAEGTVTLDGTLELLINPTVPDQTVSCGDAGVDCVFTPTEGDTFDLIVIGAETLAADYNRNGSVDSSDYAIWRDTFGSETDLTADGNQDGLVNIADYTVWRNAFGTTGSITGIIDTNTSFDNVVITDPGGVLSGFMVSVNVTSMAVTLTIDSAAAIPEPSSFVLMMFYGLAFGMFRRRRIH